MNRMKPRERLLAALRMEEPDAVPVLPPADLSWYGAVKADFLGKTETREGLDLAGWECNRAFLVTYERHLFPLRS